MYVKLNGEMVYLWRAVDHEGEIRELRHEGQAAALRFMKKALKRHGPPEAITTDGLRSYKAAMGDLGCGAKQEVSRWANNRVENSHLPFRRRRERAMLRFRQTHAMPAWRWNLRCVIGNALEVVGNDSVFDDLAALAEDRRYGRAREMIVLGLRKFKRPEAIDILIRLSDDPDVYGPAVAALAKMKAPAARKVFEAKVGDERAWIRKEARKGLERLDQLAPRRG